MLSTTNAAGPVVIIHGAWGGAHHWKPVADKLTHKYGHTVRRASLTGLGERAHLLSPEVGLVTHIKDVTNLIKFDDLHDVTLLAHSYGGVVATGVVDAVPERVARVLYLDAHLLDNGECYFTNAADELRDKLTRRANEDGDGWRIPVDWENPFGDVPHPLRTLTEPLALKNPWPAHVKPEYWLFADGQPEEKDRRYFHFQRAKARSWPAKSFDWDHNPQRSRADEVVDAIHDYLSK